MCLDNCNKTSDLYCYCDNLFYNKKLLSLRKSIKNPIFDSKTILSDNPFEAVEFFLKKELDTKAYFFWKQAKEFYQAGLKLDYTSSPLVFYYCFLNAVKALLMFKNFEFEEQHGVSGKENKNCNSAYLNAKIKLRKSNKRCIQFKEKLLFNEASIYRKNNIVFSTKIHNQNDLSLDNEKVVFKSKGILPSLQKYLNNNQEFKEFEHSLKNLLKNLVFIHRSYILTFPNEEELFIPIKDMNYIIQKKNREGKKYKEFYLKCLFDYDNCNDNIEKLLPDCFQYKCKKYIVYKTRYKWYDNNTQENKICLIDANKELRNYIYYIRGKKTFWYIRRDIEDVIKDKSPVTIMFAIMHRLSELSRYQPDYLSKYFDSEYNWLLVEFIKKAPEQFIDQIASEITGYDFAYGKVDT